MQILVLNVHSVKNSGDLVLNNTALDLIREQFPHAKLTVAMNDMDALEKLSGPVEAIPSFLYWIKFEHGRWNVVNLVLSLLSIALFMVTSGRAKFFSKRWDNLLDAYQNADIIMSCPGNFLYTSGKFSFPFIISCLSLHIATRLGKPLYILPQTIGPVSKEYARNYLKRILQRASLIFVRDQISADFCTAQLQITPSLIKLVPDIAFAAARQSEQAGIALLNKYGLNPAGADQTLIGITTIDWGRQFIDFHNQKEYEAGLVAAISKLLKNPKIKVVLFSQVFGPDEASNDRLTAKRVFDAVQPQNPNLFFIEEVVDSHTLKSAYGLMDLFVGTRLHSNIFALIQQIPVIAIQYQYKTLGIMQMAGLDDFVIKIEDASPETLPPFISYGLSKTSFIQEQINASVPQLKANAQGVLSSLKEDYEARYA